MNHADENQNLQITIVFKAFSPSAIWRTKPFIMIYHANYKAKTNRKKVDMIATQNTNKKIINQNIGSTYE